MLAKIDSIGVYSVHRIPTPQGLSTYPQTIPAGLPSVSKITAPESPGMANG